MHLCYFSNEKQKDRFWELTDHRTVHLNNCFNRSKGFVAVCVHVCLCVKEVMQCASLWLDRGELTGLVANPIILSFDQSKTTAFKLFNGRLNGKLQCTL